MGRSNRHLIGRYEASQHSAIQCKRGLGGTYEKHNTCEGSAARFLSVYLSGEKVGIEKSE